MSKQLPAVLYHASSYAQSELMPGYKRSHELVKWDQTENNQWLYATTDRQAAIDLGVASAFEKKYGLDVFHSDGAGITLHTQHQQVVAADVLRLEVYLYTIRPIRPEDGWVKNDNPHNHLLTEWKTQETIVHLQHERVNIREALKGRSINLVFNKTAEMLVREEMDTSWGRWRTDHWGR